MLIDGSFGNLLQGVSQQPNTDRLAGQCVKQLNMIADPVDGLKRRPPLEFIAKLGALDPAGKWYTYDTGIEQYMLFFTWGAVRVFTLAGVEVLMANHHAEYLDTQPLTNIDCVTIGDYTIVTNRTVVTEMLPDLTATVPGALLYFTSAGEHEQLFTITVDGHVIARKEGPSTLTASSVQGTFSLDWQVKWMFHQLHLTAAELKEDDFGFFTDEEADAAALINVQYTFTRSGSGTILMQRKSGSALIDVEVDDGHSENLTAYVTQSTVTDADRLPPVGLHGMVVAITGEGDEDEDDIYLGFEVHAGLSTTFGSAGVWRETAATGIKYKLNAATLPHAVVRLPDGTFYFGPIDGSTQDTLELERWRERDAGNEESNPIPGFIGAKISTLGTFQERMYMLADDVVNFSSTSSYFNFWNSTAVALLDSDRIELPAAHDKVASLAYGVQHNRHLVFFSDFSQFLINGEVTLTPDSANMPLTTAFEASLTTRPVSGGDVIFFPITYGAYSGIQEFYTSSEINTNNARPITEHVKRYIKGKLTQMLGNASLGLLMCRADGDTDAVYVYQYRWAGAERVQSAWGMWKFPGEVLHIFWKATTLYALVKDNTDTFLLSIDLTDADKPGLDFNVYLDAQLTTTPVNKTFTLPYEPQDNKVVVVQAEGADYPGLSVEVVSVVGDVVTIADEPNGPCVVGIQYLSDYRPSMPKIVDSNEKEVNTDRITLTRFLLTYKNTGRFTTVVSHPAYEDTEQEFSGRILGAISSLTSSQTTSGVFSAAIRRKSTDCGFSISANSYLPLTLTSIEWVGQYNKRGRRV